MPHVPLLEDTWRAIDEAVAAALLAHDVALRDANVTAEERHASLVRFELDLVEWRAALLAQISTIVRFNRTAAPEAPANSNGRTH